MFPMLLKSGKVSELALAVEDIDNFRKVYAKGKSIQGLPGRRFQKVDAYRRKQLFVFGC